MSCGPNCDVLPLLESGGLIVDAEAGVCYTTRGPAALQAGKPAVMGCRANNGYTKACLSVGGKIRHISLHRLVWASVNGPIPVGMFVCHRNNNKADNRISNLYLGSPLQNKRDAMRDGLVASGDRHHASKIRDADKALLLAAYRSGVHQAALAREYGVSSTTIHRHLVRMGAK